MAQTKSPLDSPALKEQSKHYPKHWKGKVPMFIRMLKAVAPDFPLPHDRGTRRGEILGCWVNSHGAVSALCKPDGLELGVKPDEFEVLAWHGEASPLMPCRILAIHAELAIQPQIPSLCSASQSSYCEGCGELKTYRGKAHSSMVCCRKCWRLLPKWMKQSFATDNSRPVGAEPTSATIWERRIAVTLQFLRSRTCD